MNSIIALVYLSVAVILIVFGVKQIKNRKSAKHLSYDKRKMRLKRK